MLDTVYLKDEPAYGDFAELKKLYDSIRAGLGDREMTYFANLLPTYAPGNLIANDYRTYVRDYIATVKPEVLMFDYYPFASGDTLRAMLLNNIIALQEANAAGIPLYTFIQSSGLEGGKEPTAEQLRLNVQLNRRPAPRASPTSRSARPTRTGAIRPRWTQRAIRLPCMTKSGR